MKTILTITILSVTLLFAGCTLNKTGSSAIIYTLVDKTDTLYALPDPDKIIALYGFDQSMYNGGSFQLSDFTKVSFNDIQQQHLDVGSELLSNQLNRKRLISAFKDNIRSGISTAINAPVGANNSSIYFPLATALNTVAQSKADRKYVIAYSDLMENSGYICFYHAKVFRELQDNPDRIKELLLSQVPLQSLSGITIYLSYIPRNSLDDQRYKVVANFFANLFESKGAKVIISPTIQS